MEIISEFWTKWSDIKGTVKCKDFWIAYLANIIGVPFILSWMLTIFHVPMDYLVDITKLYMMVVTVPLLTSIIRRLRDEGRKWYWILLYVWFPLRIVLLLLLLGKSREDTLALEETIKLIF